MDKIIDFHVHIGNIFSHEPKYSALPYKPERNFYELIKFRNVYLGKWNYLAKPILESIGRKDKYIVSIGDLRQIMNSYKITKSVVHALEPYVRSLDVISACKNDNSLIPFCSVDPHDPEKSEKLRMYKKRGAKGVKFHPVIQKAALSESTTVELFEEVQKIKLPVLCHSGWGPIGESANGDINSFPPLIERFPRVKFILAHLGMYQSKNAIRLGESYPNVLFDLSWQPAGNISRAINQLGSKRLLFGSDWPFVLPSSSIEIIKNTVEDKKDQYNIFYGNSSRLLGL
ncbi:amidohydrolase family protein [Candidatus Woesearchaeota archaeon]|nr:amidohydrolase family protein [Candidatus Woesearchaeota archaeon]